MKNKKKFNPKSARGSKALKRQKLVQPVSDADKKNFNKIQKQWYAKLAKDGFKDLEWVDHNTGIGQNSGFLKNSMAGGRAYHAGRSEYFQLASNYLEHCKSLRGYKRFIWKHHTAGKTYEEILELLKPSKHKTKSIYTLFYDLQEIKKHCLAWNVTNAEGLVTKRQEDASKIQNSILAEFDNPEYDWTISNDYAMQKYRDKK